VAVTGVPNVGYAALVAYTTSRIPRPPLPQGILHFGAQEAAKMGHRKPFLLNPGLMAHLPVNSAYFPFLDQSDQGVLGHASKSVQKTIARTAKEIRTKRPEAFKIRGPSLHSKYR
jgi:hypothetical protein